jgi:hypothetical protein
MEDDVTSQERDRLNALMGNEEGNILHHKNARILYGSQELFSWFTN